MVQLDNFQCIACIRFVQWCCYYLCCFFLSQSSCLYLYWIRDAFHYQHQYYTSGCHPLKKFPCHHIKIASLLTACRPHSARKFKFAKCKQKTHLIFLFSVKNSKQFLKIDRNQIWKILFRIIFRMKHRSVS